MQQTCTALAECLYTIVVLLFIGRGILRAYDFVVGIQPECLCGLRVRYLYQSCFRQLLIILVVYMYAYNIVPAAGHL